jgi:FKBP12-rapamycin complex-associated protein
VDGNIKPYLPKIMDFVRSALPSKIFLTKETPRKNLKFDPSIFTCLTLLSISTKSAIRGDILEMLDSMLATGLSPALTTALREIQLQIPSLKKEINEGLLKILSQILMNQPYRHPGMPKNNLLQTFSGTSSMSSSSTTGAVYGGVSSGSYGSGDSADSANVVLALETLAKFDVDSNSVIQFVKHCADVFLTSDCKEIRLEAVRTCSTLLRMAIQVKINRNRIPCSDVLTQLIFIYLF